MNTNKWSGACGEIKNDRKHTKKKDNDRKEEIITKRNK
jgi:hypothetical protein